MEIYADIVFIINLVMDFLIFLIAGKLSQMKTSRLRLFLGSAASALLYCLIALVPFLRPYYNFFTALAALMIGLLIAYNPKTLKNMFKLVVFSNIAAFAIGGAGFAFFYYTNIVSIIGQAFVFTTSNLSVKLLLTATAAVYVGLKLFLMWLSKTGLKKQVFYNIVIYLDHKEISIRALMDTGNSLSDPLTKAPVIIAEFIAIKELLPETVRIIFYEKKHDELLELMNAFSQTAFIKRVRILPYTTIGRQNGMLIGFKPDTVHIIKLDGQEVESKEAIVGIYNFELSEDGSYRALLNPSIL